MRAFLLLFLAFPLIELGVMIKVGGAIGVLPTLLLLVAGVILGGALLRLAGVATALRARERLARGELPEEEMLEGLLLAVAGGLLLLPGFISDAFGLVLLLPITRRWVARKVRQRAQEQALRQRAFADELAARSGHTQPGAERPNVIEGEYKRHDG
jgi:UPF0716 protein FxsA